MRRFTLAILVAALVTVAPAAAQVSPSAGSGGAGRAAVTPLLTADELLEHVETLADDAMAGRRAGTPGAERAARYVVGAFQRAGVEPPDGMPTYLQTFEFPVGVELGPDNRLVLQHGSRLGTIFAAGRDFVPLAGSVPDRVVETVVFVGYGISAPAIGYDDYAGVDVEGRIVLALRYSPEGDDPGGRFGRYLSERHKAATARAKGARAILFVNPPATEEIDRLVPFTVDERPGSLGIAALSVTQGTARRIAAAGDGDLSLWQHEIDSAGAPASRAIPGAVLNLRVDVRPRTRTTHNVVGVVPGRDPTRARETVVIGAHYDGLGLGGPGSLDPVPGEIHNGADDNASGVAALLELAGYFAYPTNRPDRTLVFVAFGAEEEGMLGSARFVERPPVPLSSVVAMVNMDMIGRMRDEVIVYGIGSARAWPEILAAANAGLELPVTEMPEGYGPSDHAAFYLRQVPVLSFFTGVHEDYHRATDDAGEIEPEGLHAITRLVGRIVAQVANGVGRVQFDPREYEPRELAAEPREEPVGGGARIGAVPAPPTDAPGDGVTVDRVVPGSPAEAAGVRPGDRIVRLAGRTVRDVYDYVHALEALAPGSRVRVVVERGEERLTLAITPEPAPVPEAEAETASPR